MANKTTNKIVVPEAKTAMEQFKQQAASEVGVNLSKSYNGDLTSREAGSVSGQMVKNMTTVRSTKNWVFERENRVVDGHKTTVRYIAGVAV